MDGLKKTALVPAFLLNLKMNNFEPKYIGAYKSGKLKKLIHKYLDVLKKCNLCPRKCNINRLKDEKGFCRTGRLARISSAFLHFGEESLISGYRGSGTIFFSGCNLNCIFCQNYEISQMMTGWTAEKEIISDIMIKLQKEGAHNINFVTPTHVIPQILEALIIAIEKGLKIPLVFNTGGYDCPETIWDISEVFDIFLPDIKYGDDSIAQKYSNAEKYTHYCFESVKIMAEKTKKTFITPDKVLYRGTIIRHLVLPNNIENSIKVLDFISKNLYSNVFVNIMDQYRPEWRAFECSNLSRRIRYDEFNRVLEYARKIKIKNIIS